MNLGLTTIRIEPMPSVWWADKPNPRAIYAIDSHIKENVK
jgi:hypothetical protein